MKTKLLNCPFCGGEAEIYRHTRKTWRIDCGGCFVGTFGFESKDMARDAWNTRHNECPSWDSEEQECAD